MKNKEIYVRDYIRYTLEGKLNLQKISINFFGNIEKTETKEPFYILKEIESKLKRLVKCENLKYYIKES